MRAGARGRGYLAWTVAAPLAVLTGPAAADVEITPSVTVETTLTDNVDFEHDAQSDALISVRPRITLVQRGGRSDSTLDYSINAQYSTDESEVDLIHSLDGFNTMEYIEDFFFVDTAAAVSQEVINNELGTPARRGDESDNLTMVQRYSVSPYFRNRWGSFATSLLRGRLGYVDSGSSELDETIEYSVDASLSSGRDFSFYLWTVSAFYEMEDETGGEERETRRVKYDNEIVLDRTFSLTGGIGYEKVKDDSFSEDIDGVIWDVGFDWRPGSKLQIVAQYGDRFEEENVFVDVNYDVTERTSLFARYEETLTTEQGLLLDELGFVGIDENGNLIDIRTGLPITGDEDLFGLSDQTFRRDVFTAGLTHTRERDTFTLNAEHETREFGGGQEDEVIYGGDVDWTHRLTRSMSSTLFLGYDNISFSDEDGREDDLYTLRASLSEQFSDSVNGSATYIFRTRDSNQSEEDATENAVVLSLTKTF